MWSLPHKAWYDPTDQSGIPKFVFLDNEAAAVVRTGIIPAKTASSSGQGTLTRTGESLKDTEIWDALH